MLNYKVLLLIKGLDDFKKLLHKQKYSKADSKAKNLGISQATIKLFSVSFNSIFTQAF